MAKRKTPSDGALLERATALAAIVELVQGVAAERPGVLVIEAAAGLGKTSVVAAAREEAVATGSTVRSAQSSVQERDYAFGVVRQLLGRAIQPLHPPSVAPAPAQRFAALDELYWVAADLAASGPLVLLVDDAHWCDEPSAEWLAFLVRRLERLPIGLVVATRPAPRPPAVAELLGHPLTRRIDLAPLSQAAVRTMLAARLGRPVPLDAARALRAACEGNPFYVAALCDSAAVQGLRAVVSSVTESDVPLPEGVQRAVLDRLHALGPAAVDVAHAVAVLGPDAQLDRVAALAGRDRQQVASAADLLLEAGLLQSSPPFRLAHPLLGSAVYDALPAHRATALHLAAARTLTDAHEPERAALHLLRVDAPHETWAAQVLRDAGRLALQRAAPGNAAVFLRRALQNATLRNSPELLLELGLAELLNGEATAIETLEGAGRLAVDDATIIAAARAHAQALMSTGRVGDAVAALQRAQARIGNGTSDTSQMRALLDMALVATARLDATTQPIADDVLARYVPRPSAASPADRLVMAHLSIEPVRRNGAAAEAVSRARVALDGNALLAEEGTESPTTYLPMIALTLCDELDEARQHLTEAVATARRTGSVLGVCLASSWRSHAAFRAGDIAAAQADAEISMNAATSAGLHLFAPYVVAFLTDALVETGEHQRAAELWTSFGLGGELPPVLPANYLLFSRGSFSLATGNPSQAAADLLESGRRQEMWECPGVGFWPWRSRAALALAAVGQLSAAETLADEEIELAQGFGAPRPLGIALHARAVLAEGSDRLDRLVEAENVLANSPDRLELARVRVERGAALRRANRRGEAVEVLQPALEASVSGGASRLASRARSELLGAGARPRRTSWSGIESLTASERQTAILAAAGHTNRDIARLLFVTTKTVETHLTRVYQKLGVAGRVELARVPELKEGAD